ncbi:MULTISPECIES: minor capsid protein [unclassified Egicoccus]|uniref:minor capsid protein n=1 Tax=unclassified Egicoccus TaxID=2635606 RepID=UPI00359CCF0B
MNVPTAIARLLDTLGLVTYDGPGNDVFIDAMPTTPDVAVVITGYGGPEADVAGGWDHPRIQIRVRGTADPRISRSRLQAIYDALHGLSGITLPDGTWLADCHGLQSSPQSLGRDSNGRHEHAINFELDVRNPARA